MVLKHTAENAEHQPDYAEQCKIEPVEPGGTERVCKLISAKCEHSAQYADHKKGIQHDERGGCEL